jgi:hypothetical protein
LSSSPSRELKLVVIESPYAGEVERNVKYARLCVRDSIQRGEAPYASHLFFTQDHILDDLVEDERRTGIEAGLAWGEKAELTAVYDDFGISGGMQLGIDRALAAGRPIEYRKLPPPIMKSNFGG